MLHSNHPLVGQYTSLNMQTPEARQDASIDSIDQLLDSLPPSAQNNGAPKTSPEMVSKLTVIITSPCKHPWRLIPKTEDRDLPSQLVLLVSISKPIAYL